ncbi:signal peptidase II [Haematomicrobium sanguinis]|uniref:signal peptidase II n=1 Tax=Haematomicrobium sanguinis TaxID=479106 RepID=UPI00068C399C|nr:signal peptidase II [Haematomicrobium sanguinis]
MKTRHAFGWLALFAVIIYAADQLMKLWVVANMTEGESFDVWPPFLKWYFIRNPGAAFSIGEDYTIVFTIIMIIASAAILFFIRKVRSIGWAIALGLILGGALGNLTDRLFQPPGGGWGYVVDYVSVPNFAIFNFADVGVTSGVCLVILLTLLGIGYDGKRQRKSEETETPTEASS